MASTTVAMDIIARDLASSKLNSIGRAADRSAGPLGSMGSKLKGLAVAAGVAAGAGVVFAAKWGVEAVKAASADAEAQAMLAGQIRRSTDARKHDIAGVEDWVAAQGEALGVTDDELRPALSRLVTATKDVGDAQSLVSVAMDVSAARGKSLQAVSEALGRAADGNTASLGRLGVKTKDAAGEALSFDEIVRQLSDNFGGAAAEKADTYAGKMNRLRIKYDETKEAIGARLLPKLMEFADWLLEDGIPAAEKLGRQLEKHVTPAMEELAEATRQFKEDAEPLTDLLAGSGDAADDASAGWKVFKLEVLKATWGLKVLGKALGVVGELGRQMWNNWLQPVFKNFANAIADLMQLWANLLEGMSHIPKFGWAKKAAEDMQNAADKAHNFADGIRDIPKNVDVYVRTHYMGGFNDPENVMPGGSGGGRSGGTQERPSGRTVAKNGRTMSGGADVSSIAQALRQVLDGARLQIVPGTSDQYYLLTGSGL